MGFVDAREVPNGGGEAARLDWQSLGQLVQSKTLEAVSHHFFHLGVADLCMDAIKSMEVQIDSTGTASESELSRELKFAADRSQRSNEVESERPRELKFAARYGSRSGDEGGGR